MRNVHPNGEMRAIVVLVLIVLIIATFPLASVTAQDYYERFKPTMNGPNINVTSPQNGSAIQSNSLQLIFNVTKPQIVKLSPNIPLSIIENNGVRNSSGIITRVYYKGDWQTNQTILYSNQDSNADSLEFNETLSGIPNGEHQVEITATGSIGLIVAMFGFTYPNEANTTIVFSNNFDESTPTPYLPTDRNAPHAELIDYLLPISVILVIIIVLSTVILRRHRKTAILKQ